MMWQCVWFLALILSPSMTRKVAINRKTIVYLQMNSGIFKIEMVLPVNHSANTPFVLCCGQQNSFLRDKLCWYRIRVPHGPRISAELENQRGYSDVQCFITAEFKYAVSIWSTYLHHQNMSVNSHVIYESNSSWPNGNTIMQCSTGMCYLCHSPCPALMTAGVYTNR